MERFEHHARLELSLLPPIARAVHGALLPEAAAPSGAGETPKTRAAARLERDDLLVLDLEAQDLAALRASVNSHLRWVDAAIRAAGLAG